MLTKCSKDTLNINNMITLYSLQVAKYNKNELQNLQDLKESGEGLVRFQFKIGYVEQQLFVAVSVNYYMRFYGRCLTNFYRTVKSCVTGMQLGV